MDPVTLSTLFGSATLVWLGLNRTMQERVHDDTIVLRKIFDTSDGWMATELMSAEALNATGHIMNLSLIHWWPSVKSGFFKVVVLSQPGAPLQRQIVLLLESAGNYGWYLSQAHHPGYRRVEGRLNYQRIESVLNECLNKDPAEEVVNTAAKILDLTKRYAYLKRALTANPQLSALLSQSEPFLEITRSTVKQVDPETYEEVEEKKERRLEGKEPVMRALPVYDTLEAEVVELEEMPARH